MPSEERILVINEVSVVIAEKILVINGSVSDNENFSSDNENFSSDNDENFPHMRGFSVDNDESVKHRANAVICPVFFLSLAVPPIFLRCVGQTIVFPMSPLGTQAPSSADQADECEDDGKFPHEFSHCVTRVEVTVVPSNSGNLVYDTWMSESQRQGKVTVYGANLTAANSRQPVFSRHLVLAIAATGVLSGCKAPKQPVQVVQNEQEFLAKPVQQWEYTDYMGYINAQPKPGDDQALALDRQVFWHGTVPGAVTVAIQNLYRGEDREVLEAIVLNEKSYFGLPPDKRASLFSFVKFASPQVKMSFREISESDDARDVLLQKSKTKW